MTEYKANSIQNENDAHEGIMYQTEHTANAN